MTRACAVDRIVHTVHGSTVDRPFKTKGYLIWAVHCGSKGPGRARAGAAATTPESGGARRELTGASPRWCSRPSFRPRVGATCCAGACAHDHGVRGNDWASPAASTVRGAARSLRRARGGNAVREKKRNWAGDNAYHAQRMTAG
jgi:hypothetical protein